MKRDTAAALVLALLALLAIGVAAATLQDPVSSSAGDGFGAGSGDGVGSGSGAEETPTDRNQSTNLGLVWLEEGEVEIPTFCIKWLDSPPVLAALAAIILLIGALVGYFSGVRILGVVIIPPLALNVFFVVYLLSGCQPIRLDLSGGAGLGSASQGANNSTPGGGMGEAASSAASQPSLLLGVILVILVAAAIVLLFFATGDAGEEPDDPEEMPPEPSAPDIGAIGRAAGTAADRIAGEADAANEVYRAWGEMTTYLAVEGPESSTPEEFAEAAVAAGMAPDDVRELTDLFEMVRYGDAEVTADREARAVDALRRIEDSYAEGES